MPAPHAGGSCLLLPLLWSDTGPRPRCSVEYFAHRTTHACLGLEAQTCVSTHEGSAFVRRHTSDAWSTVRTTNTEYGARRPTFSATLPNSTYIRPVRPCVSMMMRSTWQALARSTIS